jgi:hypothetical protein
MAKRRGERVRGRGHGAQMANRARRGVSLRATGRWVYNPGSSEVDALLMENSEPPAKLKWRLFPEPYAIHWAADKAQ